MTGKEKCKLLRQIRKEIAANNHIPYFPTACTYEGDDCVGSCPMCEAEAAYLDRELNERAARGASITVRGVSLETFRESCPDPFDMDNIPLVEAGVMACDEDPEPKSPMDMHLEELPFPEDCLRALKGANIHTVAQLVLKNSRDLIVGFQLSAPQVAQIRKVLGQVGLYLKPDIPEPPLAGVMIPRDQTPGYMVPVDKTHSNERLKGALRPRDIRRMKDELEIAKLGLSMGALQVLVRSDIKTISKLIRLSREDLRKLDGISKRKMEEIIEKVHRAGLYFKGEDQWVSF